MRAFGAALKRHNEGPDIARLRDDLEFSRAQGPNVMVMTTQEAVIAALAYVDSPNMEGEHEGTVHHHCGGGNWFARYGQVQQWIVQGEARMMDETAGD